MNENYEKIINRLYKISRSKRFGYVLESEFLSLDLEDPEGPLCKPVGTDEIGKCRCNICPLSEGVDSGCMRLIRPIQSALARKESTKAKVRMENLRLHLVEANEKITLL